jgi:hypothetical protein
MVRIDMHINADGVIRNNRERLRRCTNEPGFAPLHIQNVIARRQRNAIVSILIRRNSRDFFFVASAQDDEWIQRIFSSFHHCSRRVLIGELDRRLSSDFMSYEACVFPFRLLAPELPTSSTLPRRKS